MTRDEAKADVDAAVEEFAQFIQGLDAETSGVPKPPTIEVDEVSLEGVPFDFGIEREPSATAEVGEDGIIITYPRTGACCFAESGECFIETEEECGTDGGEYQGNDTDCVPNPCVVLPPCGGCYFSHEGRAYQRVDFNVVIGDYANICNGPADGCVDYDTGPYPSAFYGRQPNPMSVPDFQLCGEPITYRDDFAPNVLCTYYGEHGCAGEPIVPEYVCGAPNAVWCNQCSGHFDYTDCNWTYSQECTPT
jgi:hypothetical protein